MIPKLYFQRSWVYDRMLKPTKSAIAFDEKLIQSRIKSYEKIWNKEGDKILKELAKVTKLSWHNPEISCYVTCWRVSPFSDPLTINAGWDAGRTRDIVTHELIHRIISHSLNFPKIEKNWKRLMKKYSKYTRTTSLHIPIHAIHEHIFRKFYGEKELNWDKIPKFKDYYTAWQVVEKDGYKNIITELTKGLK